MPDVCRLSLILVNVLMMVFRYCYIQLHISQRWSLALIVFAGFYIPVGLKIMGGWIENVLLGKRGINRKVGRWFYILLIIGLSICVPKLVRPIRSDKQVYRTVAEWLNENTARGDIIAVPDKRISFYAERKGVLSKGDWVPRVSKYAIKVFKNKGKMFLYGVKMKKKLSLANNWYDKKYLIGVYRIIE